MKAVLLQISDMHLRRGDNPVLSRVEAIQGAVRGSAHDASVIFVVMTGDVAFGGSSSEYALAHQFFDELKASLLTLRSGIRVEEIFIPGNHDCLLKPPNVLRDYLLKSIRTNIEAPYHLDGELTTECLKVQDEFFKFRATRLSSATTKLRTTDAINSLPRSLQTEAPSEVQTTSDQQPLPTLQDLLLQGADRLFYRHTFQLYNGGQQYQLRFDCYNTAWMSQVHEQSGQLFLPLGLARTFSSNRDNISAVRIDQTDADGLTNAFDRPEHEVASRTEFGDDITVSLFHHPYGWLDPNNARAFRKEVESLSDIIMTGHEHVAEQYQKRPLEGGSSEYFEGAVLQETMSSESGFNMLLLDFTTRRRKIVLFTWNDDLYIPIREGDWEPLAPAQQRSTNRFENTDQFADYLSDVGANFTHPAKPRLALEDVFVYPDCDERIYVQDGKRETLLSIVPGDKLLGYVLENRKVLFLGADLSGRTCLAKQLYADLQKKGLVPLLLEGKNIRNPDPSAIERLITDAVTSQYGANLVERFKQKAPQQRVLLLDNFHAARLNTRGQNFALEALGQWAEHILVFVDNLWDFRSVTHEGEDVASLLQFKHCEIRELGIQGRGRIIEKWFELGREFTTQSSDLDVRIKNAEHLVSTLLSKSLLPAYPLFILTILQQYETHSTLDTATGSYGYYFEVLITTSLQNRSKQIHLDMLYPVLSRIAYRLFDKRQKSLSEDELEEVVEEYRQEYQVGFSSEEMRRVLQEARMIYRNSEGAYLFPYKYIGYYFVARYIRDNLDAEAHQATLHAQVAKMTRQLYVEDHANIIIFLVYLTKNRATIAAIIAQAKSLFAEYEPCDMTTHVAFASRLSSAPIQLQLPDGSEKERRDEQRAALDESYRVREERLREEEEPELDESESDPLLSDVADSLSKVEEVEPDKGKQIEIRNDSEDKELDDLLKFNAALKTLQIMGQILRSFPGTLHGELKIEIARESYLLGLRALHRLLNLFEGNIDLFREQFAEAVVSEELLPADTEEQQQELRERANDWLYHLMLAMSYSFLKRISYAVGSEYLKETYKRIVSSGESVSINLIDVSIKLDHFAIFPTSEVLALHERLEKQVFADTILRRMVYDYLYSYTIDYRLRQSICSKLNIKANSPKMLTQGNKKQ